MRISDWSSDVCSSDLYGTLSLTGVLVKSSNVGAIKIANQLSASQQYSAYHRFGLGQTSGSGFPGESAGVLASAEAWGPVEKQTIAKVGRASSRERVCQCG